ncbi:hypothetical protein NVM02_004325 [Salmonella enterica]|nr:hypothetical protein [Salmonella enterica]EJO9815104.1 hypothetical protein [Salmonella enterica]EJP1054003.1 hypothetical protein [Salmonella enterica]EJP1071723.1 hypothetical protein [Salmonella enterica]EJP1093274.1 hypothetical protein [Salmonella enterica]
MSQSLQEASTDVLDVLIQAGTNKLSLEESKRLKTAAQTALGSDVEIDVTKPANVILTSLRPLILEQVGNMAKTFESQAKAAVESMDEKLAKETLLTLWPNLKGPQKVLIVLLVLTTVVITGAMAWDTHLHYPEELTDVLIVALLPLFAQAVFFTWPIKTLAYNSMAIGAKVVEYKLNKSNAKQQTTAPKV